ncbi:MAG: Glutaredoxin-like protein NrdH, required for reduction of Ribonucleotide reductase class Ib, partial [uncultured Arthrobacter sp.]
DRNGLHQASMRTVQRHLPGSGQEGNHLPERRYFTGSGRTGAPPFDGLHAGPGRHHGQGSLVRFPPRQDQRAGRAVRHLRRL